MKKKRTYKIWTGYDLPYAICGGMSRAYIKSECKRLGIPVENCYTIYAGHYGLKVPSGFATKFERKVLNWGKHTR